jgi:hypothetical protein
MFLSKALTTLEKNQFPTPGLGIMPKDVAPTVVSRDFEIPMIRRKPTIFNSEDLNRPVSEPETLWRFFAAVSGITRYANFHGAPFLRVLDYLRDVHPGQGL